MPDRARILGWRVWLISGALCLWFTTPMARAQDCVGDCDDSGTVTIDELIRGVNINLGSQLVSVCPAFDCDDTGTVPVNCLIQGVNNSLEGCGEPCALAPGAYTLTQVEGGVEPLEVVGARRVERRQLIGRERLHEAAQRAEVGRADRPVLRGRDVEVR